MFDNKRLVYYKTELITIVKGVTVWPKQAWQGLALAEMTGSNKRACFLHFG
jgi:hypothetical protein